MPLDRHHYLSSQAPSVGSSLADLEKHEEIDHDKDSAAAAEEHRRVLETCLIRRAYHLPGITQWQQDWWQYLTNNHPLFGIQSVNTVQRVGREDQRLFPRE